MIGRQRTSKPGNEVDNQVHIFMTGLPKGHSVGVELWMGLHLFPFGMGNCSQRVRTMLEEKQLPREGHYVDTPKGDNLTDF